MMNGDENRQETVLTGLAGCQNAGKHSPATVCGDEQDSPYRRSYVENRRTGVLEMHAYCLFCETQRCRQIAAIITKDFEYQCIYPQIVQRKWVKGVPTEVCHDWLPGYLFLYSEYQIQKKLNVSGIIRCLGNGELVGQDVAFAEMIYKRQGIMGTVSLLQEGDRCSVADPAWAEIHGKVVKMDFGRKRCCIEFEFDGIRRTIWVGYELIRPNPEN